MTLALNRWTPVDRIVSMEPGKGARGVRNVPNTLSILDSHFPRFAVLPGVLILGSMGTLASMLLREQTGRQWRLAGAEQVRYRHWVRPGDELDMSVELQTHTEEMAVLSATARVDGRAVVTARRLRLVPLENGSPQEGPAPGA